MKHLAMYGASDDLIEFEGDFSEELCQEEVTLKVAGLEITIDYTGVWGINIRQIDEDTPVTAEEMKLSIQPRMDGLPGYSMRLDMDIPDEEMANFENVISQALASVE